MAKHRGKSQSARPQSGRGLLVGALVILVVGGIVFALSRKPATNTTSGPVSATNIAAAAANSTGATNTTELPFILVNQALMVTVELDFGGPLPSVAEALRQIERRHQPDDGRDRVFAVLDGYGEPTADGKKLHLSMHVSTEKPGIGSLVFKRTGESLWSGRIISTNNAATFSGSQLMILLDVGDGRLLTVDGSGNPGSILEAKIKELNQPISEFWKDGAEHEMTFIYSACGCPVKVMCRRVGDRTERTKEMPVIFPDDPAVVEVIKRLMRW